MTVLYLSAKCQSSHSFFNFSNQFVLWTWPVCVCVCVCVCVYCVWCVCVCVCVCVMYTHDYKQHWMVLTEWEIWEGIWKSTAFLWVVEGQWSSFVKALVTCTHNIKV